MADDELTITRNDDHLADLIEPDFSGKVKYDWSLSQWHFWDDLRWKPDKTQHVYEMTRVKAMSLLGATKSAEKQKALLPLLNVSKKTSVLESLASRDRFAMTGEEWDVQPNLIGVRDGVLDLETLKLHRNPDPDWLITKQADALWEPKDEPGDLCPMFMHFLRQITGGSEELAEYLLSVIGYSMFGHQREQKFWMWLGDGTNGKGTLAKIVTAVLGEYGGNHPNSLYMQSGRNVSTSSAPRADLIRLKGQRWVWMSEPQGGKFNDEMLKEHTGDDPITARDLFAKASKTMVWRPTHTIIILTNNLPKTDDVGASMRRRARVVKFEQDFTAVMDPGLEERILKAETNGIFKLFARFAQRYHFNGLAEPQQVLDWSSAYIDSNDPISQFVIDRCVVDVNAKAQAKLLYAEYQDWCAAGGLESLTQSGFGHLISKRFRNDHTRTGSVYHGVGLMNAMQIAERDDDEPD